MMCYIQMRVFENVSILSICEYYVAYYYDKSFFRKSIDKIEIEN